jgi:hypothetical protein
MCEWGTELRRHFDAAIEQAVPAMAEIVPTLSAQQIASIEKRYAKKNEEYRDDFLDRDLAKRRTAMVKREVERAEDFYGRLDDAQRAFVAKAMTESPWHGETAYDERLRRQADLIATVRRLAARRAAPAEAQAEVRDWLRRAVQSPNEPYRQYATRLADYNCKYAAELHNLMSAEQRQKAVKKVKEYEDELRALVGDGAS